MFKIFTKCLSVLSFSIILAACGNLEQPKCQITSIELATGDCYGECPHTAIYIDSTLSYKYFGGEYADKKGYYKGKISQAMWDTLNRKLEQVQYRRLDTTYEHTSDDQRLEVIIHYYHKVKHITAQDYSLPDSVAKVFYWIARTYKSVKLIPSKDSIAFTTDAQNPFRITYPLDRVRFPPPKRSR